MKSISVLCFGDSWTHGNYHALTEQIYLHGHKNVKITAADHWGSTAEYFANYPHLLPKAVSKSKADYVLLSLGGNDYKNFYIKHNKYMTPWAATSEIKESLRSVLNALYNEHPNVKVVMYGYDFVGNAEKWLFYGNPNSAWRHIYSWVGIPLINFGATYLSSTLDSLERDFKGKGYSFTHVPLWGSLQRESQKSKGYSLWRTSRDEYMQDPIHANAKGFGVLLGNLYNQYFAKEFNPSPPSI